MAPMTSFFGCSEVFSVASLSDELSVIKPIVIGLRAGKFYDAKIKRYNCDFWEKSDRKVSIIFPGE